MVTRSLSSATAAVMLFLVLVNPVRAEPLASAEGQVVLTVSGSISVTNNADSAHLDFPLLEQMPGSTLRTTTPWTEGVQEFEGVLLRDLLDRLGADARLVRARALNDYTIEIPAEDFAEADVLIAYRHNGQRMSVRKKGPLWIVYPDDSGIPDAAKRMIWQLTDIEAVR